MYHPSPTNTPMRRTEARGPSGWGWGCGGNEEWPLRAGATGELEDASRGGLAHIREELGSSEEIHTYVSNQRKSQHLDSCYTEGTGVSLPFISPPCPALQEPLLPPAREGASTVNLMGNLDCFQPGVSVYKSSSFGRQALFIVCGFPRAHPCMENTGLGPVLLFYQQGKHRHRAGK